jgi:hypothetical protein
MRQATSTIRSTLSGVDLGDVDLGDVDFGDVDALISTL